MWRACPAGGAMAVSVCRVGVSYRGQVDEKALAEKLARMRSQLNERQWRRLLGAEAEAIGWGGIKLVARLAGVSVNTVSKGA
jgi:hypothetical protein